MIIDENRFQKPVKVQVHGKKVNAQFNVVPKHHLGGKSEVLHFVEDPIVSRQLHYVRDPSRHHRIVKLRRSPRPLHLRRHIIFRKNSKDPRPQNIVDEVIDSGVKSVSNFAKSVLPSVFGPPPQALPRPKMHRFKNIPFDQYPSNKQWRKQHVNIIEKPSVRKGNHLNNVERGLEDLIRTDEEIPR